MNQQGIQSPYQNDPAVAGPPVPASSEDGLESVVYKQVDWSSFPRYGSLKRQLKWCKKTLLADRLLWVFPYFYHNQPGVCVVDGTDCADSLIYQKYDEEMKEILIHWPVMSDMDGGRALTGTYCPACMSVLLTAIAIRRMMSTQRQKKTMNPFTRLYRAFQKKKHQVWGMISLPNTDGEKDEEKKWEDAYAPFITLAKKDKLPVYMVDTNETIIIIKKEILDKKYNVEEKKEVKEE